MINIVQHKPRSADMILEGDFTIREAADLRDKLLSVLTENDTIRLYFNVGTVDITFLQLICAAHLFSRRNNKRLLLSGPMQGAVLNAVKDSGFLNHPDTPRHSSRRCLWRMHHAAEDTAAQDHKNFLSSRY